MKILKYKIVHGIMAISGVVHFLFSSYIGDEHHA